jgi:hypothetical protein
MLNDVVWFYDYVLYRAWVTVGKKYWRGLFQGLEPAYPLEGKDPGMDDSLVGTGSWAILWGTCFIATLKCQYWDSSDIAGFVVAGWSNDSP